MGRTAGEGTVYKVYLKPASDGAGTAVRETAVEAADPRAALFQWAVARRLTILTLRQEADSLENVFHSLTRNTPAGL